MFTNKTSLIIPTKNRSDKIIELVSKLFFFKIEFNEIIVVDSSSIDHAKKFKLNVKKVILNIIIHEPPLRISEILV